MSILDIVLDFLFYSADEGTRKPGLSAAKIISWIFLIAALAFLIYSLSSSEVRIF